MPSHKKARSIKQPKKPPISQHVAFFPLLLLTLIIWFLYRSLFHFPVWFDETVGKALFFGLPVWLYLGITKSRAIWDTFAPYKLHSGLLLGIAVGGLFGFVGTFVSILQTGGAVEATPLFLSNRFWYEFLLAIMTGFWETLLFYSFVMVVIQEKFAKWSLLAQVVLVALIFVVFHIPNTLLRFEGMASVAQVLLLFVFALGQGMFFANRRNLYALTISHAIWGMVLLVHGS